MLQQTQVARVTDKWRQFVATYPSAHDLAESELSDVLALWSGLGYPRRAKALRDSAKVIIEQHGGRVPSDLSKLLALPGIGDYTARAVMAFAYNEPAAAVDTNVARVLSRALAGRSLTRLETQELADRLLGDAPPREFNQAMIDLGATKCKKEPRCETCPLRQLCRYRELGGADPAAGSAGVSRAQAPFRGSMRELRGKVLKELTVSSLTLGELAGATNSSAEMVLRAVTSLETDGLLTRRRGRVRLAN